MKNLIHLTLMCTLVLFFISVNCAEKNNQTDKKKENTMSEKNTGNKNENTNSQKDINEVLKKVSEKPVTKANKTDDEKIAESLAQAQLDAYNAHDIETFLKQYSENCTIYDQKSGKVTQQGKKKMREIYSKLFDKYPKLHANVTKRMVLNNFVIDYEDVIVNDEKKVNAIAIYEIKDKLIHKVWFVQ